ncbi:MAG: hypothetical protein KGQ57_00035 [Burkholderiales bacterium]|nr:hypothetical protein [Burkholderiales bacterium]
MFEAIAVGGIPNRRTAISVHTKLRANSCASAELGRFYRYLLERQLWRSQAELAKDLGVSKAMMSRTLAMTRLPEEVIAVAGGPGRITFRLARGVEALIAKLGDETVMRNSAALKFDQSRSVEDLLRAIATGQETDRSSLAARLTLDQSGRFIRLETPHMDKLVQELDRLETIVGASITFMLSTTKEGSGGSGLG